MKERLVNTFMLSMIPLSKKFLFVWRIVIKIKDKRFEKDLSRSKFII